MSAAAVNVVVVDDEAPITRYLVEVLTQRGYACHSFQESLLALAYFAQCHPPPDLLITDIRMPGLDGMELLKQVHRMAPDLPVVLLSGYYEPAVAVEAVRAGAADYLFKPARPEEVLAVVDKHLSERGQAAPSPMQGALARLLIYYDSQERSDGQVERAADLFRILGFKRYETMQHSMRVAAYAVLLGQHCGLSRAGLKDLEWGALLHDIGKIAIPHNVLLKPGPLNEKEWRVLRTHPEIGYRLLAELPQMHHAAEIVYCHHERYDGTGYPRGLQEEQIPIGSRLFSIVDTVDAITSDRAYRRARDFAAAAAELRKGSGAQFDPQLVAAYLELPLAELLAVRDQYPDA